MSYIQERNNVNVIGKGSKPLLFLHGYGCDQTMWRFITPDFQENYKIVLMDLVGCGESDESAYDKVKYNTLDGYVEDLIEVCDDLNLRDVTLIGHSISANICLKATLVRPEMFEKLILLCPSPKFINDGDYVGGFTQKDIDDLIETVEINYLGWAKAISPVIMGNPNHPEFANELEASFCSNNPEIAKHFAKVTFQCDNREDLKEVDHPTLIIQSRHDNLASVEIGRYVHQNIPGSQLDIIESNGHCPHLSHPGETIKSISGFAT